MKSYAAGIADGRLSIAAETAAGIADGRLSIAAEYARETSGLMHTGASVPTIRDGFDKQHAEVRLSPFELGSKVLK